MNDALFPITCALVLVALSLWGLRLTRCRHTWTEVTRTFVEPMEYGLYDVEQSRKAMHRTGFTVVLLKCSYCSKLNKVEMSGRVHENKVVPLKRVK